MKLYAKLLFGAILFFCVTLANAQNVDGVLRVVKGDVQIKSAKTGQTVKARIGEKVFPKDVVITGKESRAKIVMVDQNEINVSPDSQIEIQHYEFDPAAGKKEVLLNVIYGKVRAKVEQKYDGKTSKFNVKTPSAVAGVRGTDFLTSYNKVDQSSQVTTFHGAVEFGLPGPNGSIVNPVSVTPGTQASSVAGRAPGAPTQMSKSELAKVDGDSKADTGNGPKSDRAPSNENGNKGEKEGDKKGGGDKPSASNSSGGNGREPASSAGPGPGGPGPGPGPSPSPNNPDKLFQPDTIGGPGPGSTGPGPGPAPPPPNGGGCPGGFCAPPPPPPPPPSVCPPVCPNGNTKVNVTIKK